MLSMNDAFFYHGSMRAGPSGRTVPNLFVEGPSGWLWFPLDFCVMFNKLAWVFRRCALLSGKLLRKETLSNDAEKKTWSRSRKKLAFSLGRHCETLELEVPLCMTESPRRRRRTC